MANVAISGDTSGAVTLTVPSTVGTQTATFPAATGTVMVSGNMPAFSAYLSSNQSISSATTTKILFDTKEFDTNNNFASSRFTPTVAGYYQISAATLCVSAAGTQTSTAIYIYKNGNQYKIGSDYSGAANSSSAQTISSLIYMNGSTDYIEIYGYIAGTTNSFYGSSVWTWVNGYLARSA